MLNIIIFGPPGAGKGTQSELIINRYNLKHLSTGDMLRTAIAAKTPVGIEAKKRIDAGQLVPDDVVVAIIEHELDQNKDVRGFIFDGFPRTIKQAAKLDDMLYKRGSPIVLMLSLEVPDDELVERLLNRGKSSNRSDDQEESVIRNRIEVYHNTTQPIIEYYREQNKYCGIDGVGTIDQITKRIINAVDAAFAR